MGERSVGCPFQEGVRAEPVGRKRSEQLGRKLDKEGTLPSQTKKN
jgi:hypothetical protein